MAKSYGFTFKPEFRTVQYYFIHKAAEVVLEICLIQPDQHALSLDLIDQRQIVDTSFGRLHDPLKKQNHPLEETDHPVTTEQIGAVLNLGLHAVREFLNGQ